MPKENKKRQGRSLQVCIIIYIHTYIHTGFDISTSPLAPASEFLKKGFRASTFKFSLDRTGKLIF